MRSSTGLLVILGFAVFACKDPPKTEPAVKAVESAVPSASVAAPAPSSAPAAADAGGVITLAWKAVNAANPKVAVSVVLGDETIPLGQLDATADGSPSATVEACSMKNGNATSSSFFCGGVPAYNFYTAKLTGGAVVISLDTGIEGEPATEKVTEVARRPTTATTLRSTGPASPALFGNCRPGYVQRTAESPCMRQCLKGTECKSKDKCELVAVTGTDGEHKVHACIPAAK